MSGAQSDFFTESRLIVALPQAQDAELIAAGEVLWQEGLRVWSVASMAALQTLQPIFGRRAKLGVHNVKTAEEALLAQAQGAQFLGSPYSIALVDVGVTNLRLPKEDTLTREDGIELDAQPLSSADLAEVSSKLPPISKDRTGQLDRPQAELTIPVSLGGMTPSELRKAQSNGADAIAIFPASAFDPSYGATIAGLFDSIPVVAAGEFTSESAAGWLSSGVDAIWAWGLLDESLYSSGFAQLRRQSKIWQESVVSQ